MRSMIVVLLSLLLLSSPALGGGQSCDDFDPCTVSDMCVDEVCDGTPTAGASCDDLQDCTVNDRCTLQGCMGDPPPANTECAGGCGVCTQIVPGFPFCSPKPDIAGDPCTPFGELGPCVSGTCQVFGGFVPACTATFRTCPDTDGNPCTDVCNFETGECTPQGSRCIPGCETCNPANGQCQPANLGSACDDFDPCTTASSCQVSAELGRGFCLAGTPSIASPTPTRTQPAATATRTAPVPTATPPAQTPTAAVDTPTPGGATATATSGTGSTPTPGGATCVGDCNGNLMVAINELIVGVNIALGNATVGQCQAFDSNGNGAVAINELILGVNNALDGCAA